MTAVAGSAPLEISLDTPRQLSAPLDPADRVFRGIARGSGITVLAIMTMVGLFLTYRASDAIRKGGFDVLTEVKWQPDAGHFGIAAVLTGTILIALTALFFAVPLAVGTALYINEYAPVRLRQTLISLVDLMAAVPSVVYGLWGVSTYRATF